MTVFGKQSSVTHGLGHRRNSDNLATRRRGPRGNQGSALLGALHLAGEVVGALLPAPVPADVRLPDGLGGRRNRARSLADAPGPPKLPSRPSIEAAVQSAGSRGVSWAVSATSVEVPPPGSLGAARSATVLLYPPPRRRHRALPEEPDDVRRRRVPRVGAPLLVVGRAAARGGGTRPAASDGGRVVQQAANVPTVTFGTVYVFFALSLETPCDYCGSDGELDLDLNEQGWGAWPLRIPTPIECVD